MKEMKVNTSSLTSALLEGLCSGIFEKGPQGVKKKHRIQRLTYGSFVIEHFLV